MTDNKDSRHAGEDVDAELERIERELDEDKEKEVREKAREAKIAESEYQKRDFEKRLYKLEHPDEMELDTFFTGFTYAEYFADLKELTAQQRGLYYLIGSLVDRSRKMNPQELRKEVLALVRMTPLTNQAEIDGVFLKGMKASADFIAKVAKVRRGSGVVQDSQVLEPQHSSNEGTSRQARKQEELPSDPSSSGGPMVGMNKNFGAVFAGNSIIIDVGVDSYFEITRFNVAGEEGIRGKFRYGLVPGSAHLYRGNVILTVPSTANPGKKDLMFTVTDSEGRSGKAPYYLTILVRPPRIT